MPAKPAISATTEVCGVVLHPSTHTRSPAMHNAAFEALGLDAAYLAFDVPPHELEGAIAGMRSLGIRQLAVSLPHKVEVMALLDDIEDTAHRIGAVNTVTNLDGRLFGSNTDWIGAVRALEREANVKLAGAKTVVLGAGGAARALVYGLREREAHVTVLNRTESRARALTELGAHAAGPLSNLGDLAASGYDLLVNTTTVGLRDERSPIPKEAICPGSLVMDAVYDPPQTRLLQDAESVGARVLGGKWWLVHQAAEQLRAWTHRDPPIGVMAEAFDRAG